MEKSQIMSVYELSEGEPYKTYTLLPNKVFLYISFYLQIILNYLWQVVNPSFEDKTNSWYVLLRGNFSYYLHRFHFFSACFPSFRFLFWRNVEFPEAVDFNRLQDDYGSKASYL